LGIIGLGICIIEREIRFEYGQGENDTVRILLLSVNLLTTLLLLVSLYFSYKMRFNWMKARGFLTKHDDLINTGMYKYLIGECIICILSPMPFIHDETFLETNKNYDVKIRHWYNDLLLGWSFVRIYLVIRCVLANSFYMSTRAQRVCQMNGCYANFMFAIKCLMKDQAYLVLMGNLIMSMFYFGYLIRIFDQDLSEVSGQNFDSITNPVWLSIVTMTTVGYGDFFPKSNPSRIVGILCSFYGVYLVSLFVIALENLLLLDQSEERSYELICRLEDKESLKLEAVNVITSAFRHKKAKGDYPDKKKMILGKLKTFRKYLMNFQTIAKSIRGNYGMDTPTDRVRREIDDLRTSIHDLTGSLKALSEHFGCDYIETKPTGGLQLKGSTDDSDNKKD
jgi:potassium intermediate/small conductance calcium-activated channel subfamily N protein 2